MTPYRRTWMWFGIVIAITPISLMVLVALNDPDKTYGRTTESAYVQTGNFYALMNSIRSSRHLAPVKEDPDLESLAWSYAAICAIVGGADEETITPWAFGNLVERIGTSWDFYGEIVLSGPAAIMDFERVVEKSMASADDRRLLLDPHAKAIGIAEFLDPQTKTVFVAVYVGSSSESKEPEMPRSSKNLRRFPEA